MYEAVRAVARCKPKIAHPDAVYVAHPSRTARFLAQWHHKVRLRRQSVLLHGDEVRLTLVLVLSR